VPPKLALIPDGEGYEMKAGAGNSMI